MIFTNSMFAWEVSFTVEDFEHGSDCQSSSNGSLASLPRGLCFFFFFCVYECVCLEPD
jgi:hypothetical protein